MHPSINSGDLNSGGVTRGLLEAFKSAIADSTASVKK
jgi:hypothetical protein